jgi:hypothetical protein
MLLTNKPQWETIITVLSSYIINSHYFPGILGLTAALTHNPRARCRWLTPVILAIQEAESRIVV